MRARLSVLLVPLMGSVIAIAQVPLTPAPTFEAASVKRNLSGRIGGSIQVPPAGTLSFTNVMLRVLIREAYQVDAYAESYKLDTGAYAHIVGNASGGPQPDVPRFDVRGKPPDNTLPAQRRAMMRALLEDRFKLRVHREMRPMPVYALTIARTGRLGPQLAPSEFDCNAYLAQRRAGGTAPEPVDATGHSWCLAPAELGRPGVMVLRFAGTVTVLLQRLEPYVDRPIVDATGLSGNFEWLLTFARVPNSAVASGSGDAPELFTAVQEQLGLKLEARQAPLEVLAVDSVELPTSD